MFSCCLRKKKYEEEEGKGKEIKQENNDEPGRQSQQEIGNDTSSSIVINGAGPRDKIPPRNSPTEGARHIVHQNQDSGRKKKNIQEELVHRRKEEIEHGNSSTSSSDIFDDNSVDFPKQVGAQAGSDGKQGGGVTYNITGKYLQFGKNSTIKNYTQPKKKKKKQTSEKESRTTASPHQEPKSSTEPSFSKCSNDHLNAIPCWPLQNCPQPSPGNLKAQFDRTDAVYNQRLIVNLASSVGIISSSSTCGTGFRVGPNYVMTAKHVKDGILKAVPVQIAHQQQPIITHMSDQNVHIDFSYEIPNQPVDENSRFFFEPEIPYESDDLDTAILKLQPSANAYPPPLIRFSELREMDVNLYFIGHPKANVKELDRFSCVKLTPYQISTLQNWRLNNAVPPLGGFDGIENPHRQPLHCTFEKGASGAPGVWISPADQMPYVVLMLLRGFPDWYYHENTPQEFKFGIPKNYCVEQGVSMLEIYHDMKKKNPSLCQEIFHYSPTMLPAPTCEDVEMKSLENS